MTKITCKSGVRLKRVTPAMSYILFVLEHFVRNTPDLPEEVVITSIEDGTHLPDSRHYKGEAIDIRSKNFKTLADKRMFRSQLEVALNNHPLVVNAGASNLFRVLLEWGGTENEHFHVQVRKGEVFQGV